ncbi:MAG: hypothetical protein H7836_05090 [Magnetococcus sp. YQC-3]
MHVGRAKKGIDHRFGHSVSEPWIPAFAGMTSEFRAIPISVMPAKAGIQEGSWPKR